MRIKIPIVNTLRTYEKDNFKYDFFAALTVAVIAVPQAIAYAMIADIPPIYGLYTAVIATIISSVFSSSSHVISGPTNAACLLLTGVLGSYAFLPQDQFMSTVFVLTFFIGLIQFLFGFLKLGKLINYISSSVINGFLTGAAILIIFGQCYKIFGIGIPSGLGATDKFFYAMGNLGMTNTATLAVSIFTLCLILLIRKTNDRLPVQFISIILASAFVVALSLDHYGVVLIGSIPISMPSFQMLNFSGLPIGNLLFSAFSVALIGLVEAISISKSIARETGEAIDSNQEFVARGLVNIIGSFFQCFACSASLSRTTVNYHSGARTRFSGIMSGIFVAVIVLFLGSFIQYIPSAVLAVVIIESAVRMIKVKSMIRLFHANKKDFAVMAVTMMGILLFPSMDTAILLGVILSISIFLMDSDSVDIKIFEPVDGDSGRVKEIDINDVLDMNKVIVVNIDGNLYFGSTQDLDIKLKHLQNKSDVYIFRFLRVRDMDMSAIDTFHSFLLNEAADGKRIVLTSVSPELKTLFDRTHVTDLVGDDNIYVDEDVVFKTYGETLERILA